jgi:hypothetical protein
LSGADGKVRQDAISAGTFKGGQGFEDHPSLNQPFWIAAMCMAYSPLT